MRRGQVESSSDAGQEALLPLRAFYFFNFGALGALLPFVPLLFAERGLDPSEIALAMVVIPATGLVVPPLWGALADALGGRLALLRIAAIGSAASTLLLLGDWGLAGSLVAMTAYGVFRAPLTSLADAATYDAMGGEKADFSRVRVWGSVGFVFFVVLLGLVEGSTRPAVLAPVACGIHLLSAVATLPLGSPPMRRQEGVIRMTVSSVARPALLLFLLGTAVYYSGHAMYDVFFGLHARRLGQGDSFVGVAWALGVTAEIGLMLAAPRFIHKARSGLLLVVCGATAALRWGLLSVVTAPSAILATQLLHGVTFGLFYLSLAKHVQARAPASLRTSLQSIAISSMGLGMLGGFLGGGELFERFAGEGLFRVSAGVAGLSALIYLAALLADRGKGSGEGAQGSPEEEVEGDP